MKTLHCYRVTLHEGCTDYTYSVCYEGDKPFTSEVEHDMAELLDACTVFLDVESYEPVRVDESPCQADLGQLLSDYLALPQDTRWLAEYLTTLAKNGLEELRDRMVTAKAPFVEFAGLRIEVLP